MPETKSDRLHEVLEKLQTSVDGMIGVAVTSTDGLPIANAFQSEFDIDLVCAMATSLEATSRKISSNLGLKNHRCTIVDTEEGSIALYGAETLALVAVLTPAADAASLRTVMKEALGTVETILNG